MRCRLLKLNDQINTRQVELDMFGAPLSIDTSSSPTSIAVGSSPSGSLEGGFISINGTSNSTGI